MRMAVVSIHGKPPSPKTPAKVRKRIQSGGAQPRQTVFRHRGPNPQGDPLIGTPGVTVSGGQKMA
jgi:hypothetical protein